MIRVRSKAGELRLKLARMRNALGRTVTRILDEGTRAGAEVAREQAPGSLGKTIQTSSPAEDVRRIATESRVAVFQENGTRAHEITPHGRVLRFEVNGSRFRGVPLAGSFVFARRVHHPGTKALHFMRAGRDAAHAVIVARLRTLLKQLQAS